MASFTLFTSLPKFLPAGASFARAHPWNSRVFAAATPRSIQVPKSHNDDGSITTDGIKQGGGVSETINNSLNETQHEKAYSTSEHAVEKTKDAANKASASAQNIAEKAKQTMQDAWDSTKNTANKAADTVLGKTQQSCESTKNNANRAADTVVEKTKESAEYVKDNAEAVKRNMNKKN
ncbi:uncharacterized protein ECU03_1610 [Lathyrus oleraceus]|uniref:Uncharacterized protein n=1 Tax=Pisum sativum TaxID=3888 RepID=A0A9D4XXN8_PEA|nr:uncharacterized protein ECU03_1610 [Pisum sativum]KAI5428472.1 hypothetical protein KIW84_033453 [Pisum sativum]